MEELRGDELILRLQRLSKTPHMHQWSVTLTGACELCVIGEGPLSPSFKLAR